MPFIPVANTVGVEIRMSLDDQRCENTLYFEFGAGVNIGTLQALGTALETWWGAFYAPLVVDTVSLREIYLVDLTSATGPSWTQVPATPMTGDLDDEAMPNSTTLAVSFRTTSRGRSFRGRNYVVGLSQAGVVGNRVNGPVATGFQAAYEQLMAIAIDLTADWVVVSRFANGDPRPAGVTTVISAVVITDTVVDSQRRRLPGRGT